MVYLDWASTAVPNIHVSDYAFHWFNPNSHYAVDECLAFGECEEKVKKALGAKSGKVIFGGNASWFFAKLYSIVENYWLCSPYEHGCVYDNGLVVQDMDKVKYLRNEICCHQYVNNITGEVFPVKELGKMVKDKGGFFVCDMTASVGRCAVPDGLEDWCDAVVLSSHKIGVDNKQIGCAWVSDEFYKWLLLEGNVVNGYGFVDGTPDLASAKATTDAIVEACENIDKNNRPFLNLVFHLESELRKNNIKYRYVSPLVWCSAISAIVLPNINADALCQYLASNHCVYISPGHSTCEGNSDYRVLKKYGLSQEECESTIRVSFGPSTTEQNIDALVNGIVEYKKVYVND